MKSIVVEALLVRAEDHGVRLIVGDLCLEFSRDDVIAAEQLPTPEGLVEGSAIAAKVTLRPRAPVVRIASSRAYLPLLFATRLPFSLSSRQPVHSDDSEILKAEAAFLATRGLTGAAT